MGMEWPPIRAAQYDNDMLRLWKDDDGKSTIISEWRSFVSDLTIIVVIELPAHNLYGRLDLV